MFRGKGSLISLRSIELWSDCRTLKKDGETVKRQGTTEVVCTP